MKNDKCIACGSKMRQRIETVDYEFAGVGVTLGGVRVLRCSKCGQREIGIPAIATLQKLMAQSIAKKRARLTPVEIRFLRKSLGLSSTDLARKMGVTKSTVSRWESKNDPQEMGPQSEKLLRVLALTERPVEEYSLEDMASAAVAPVHLSLVHGKKGWQPHAA